MPNPTESEKRKANDASFTPLDERLSLSKLPALLKNTRKERGLTLKEVEAETGLSISTLSRIENGRFRPNAANYQQLLGWLNIDTSNMGIDKPRLRDTMTEIGLILKRDDKLDERAVERLMRAWRPMYELYSGD